MARIIAGTLGGRRLVTPPGRDTRPTSERVREAVFGRLDHLDVLSDARVLDLYAGSGALGLEAVSRGARSVTLVEKAKAAVDTARRNVTDLGLRQVRVVAADVALFLRGPAPVGGFDLVLADPPYDLDEEAVASVIGLLVGGGWLAEDALVVLERSARSPEPAWPTGLTRVAAKTYGETAVWFAHARGGDGGARDEQGAVGAPGADHGG